MKRRSPFLTLVLVFAASLLGAADEPTLAPAAEVGMSRAVLQSGVA